MESAHAINVSDVKFREQFISRDGRLRPSRALGLYFSIGDKVFVRALRMPADVPQARGHSYDHVIRRSSCSCIRQGCVGTTRTLKPYVPLSVAGTLPW
jgi:hypothetical protein